ncbi:hypothetical protein Q675_00210 [Labrenzia sp. C1B70]|nr:hypothetical protein Q675_00210 [Labrenzia sp. C1B70]
MIDRQTTLSEDFLKVAIQHRVPRIARDRVKKDFLRVMRTFRGNFHLDCHAVCRSQHNEANNNLRQDLFLQHPLVTIPMARHDLGDTAAAVDRMIRQLGPAPPFELTGLDRYRAWLSEVDLTGQGSGTMQQPHFGRYPRLSLVLLVRAGRGSIRKKIQARPAPGAHTPPYPADPKPAEQGLLHRQVVEPIHVPAGVHAFEEKEIVTRFYGHSVDKFRTAAQPNQIMLPER